MSESLGDAADLVCELARGAQDERARAARAREPLPSVALGRRRRRRRRGSRRGGLLLLPPEPRDDRTQVRERLPGPRVRREEEVGPAGEDRRDRGGLRKERGQREVRERSEERSAVAFLFARRSSPPSPF